MPTTRAAVRGEQRAAVPFAAGGIEHATPAHHRRDGAVAMPVLVPDRAAHSGVKRSPVNVSASVAGCGFKETMGTRRAAGGSALRNEPEL